MKNENKQPEIDYSEMDFTTGNIFITPIGNKKEINLENELERLISYMRDIPIHIDKPQQYNRDLEKANEIFFNFNVGLLCGIKIAKDKT